MLHRPIRRLASYYARSAQCTLRGQLKPQALALASQYDFYLASAGKHRVVFCSGVTL